MTDIAARKKTIHGSFFHPIQVSNNLNYTPQSLHARKFALHVEKSLTMLRTLAHTVRGMIESAMRKYAGYQYSLGVKLGVCNQDVRKQSCCLCHFDRSDFRMGFLQITGE